MAHAPDRRSLRGSCHCGRIGVVFSPSTDPAALFLRACQCSFCRRHGGRTTSDPGGRARLLIRDPASLARHRFGLGMTDFLVCGRCGIYVGAFMALEDRALFVLNVNTLDDPSTFAREATPVVLDGETNDTRLARRMRTWTPADLLVVERARVDEGDAKTLVDAYLAELVTTLGGFDPALSVSADPDEVSPPHGVFLVLRDDRRCALACGGLKTHEPGTGEIKRMYVLPGARRRGLGRDLLHELERAARELGMSRVVLDTAEPLTRAAALYRSAGYAEVPPFNDNRYAAKWFAKPLA